MRPVNRIAKHLMNLNYILSDFDIFIMFSAIKARRKQDFRAQESIFQLSG